MPVKVLQSVAQAELEKTLRALQAEVANLKEENASLRLHQFRGTALPGRIEGLRQLRTAVREAHTSDEDAGSDGHSDEVALDITDDAWRVLTETLVVRDVLLEMCNEVHALTERLADRLEALAVWAPEELSTAATAKSGGDGVARRPRRGTPVTAQSGSAQSGSAQLAEPS